MDVTSVIPPSIPALLPQIPAPRAIPHPIIASQANLIVNAPPSTVPASIPMIVTVAIPLANNPTITIRAFIPMVTPTTVISVIPRNRSTSVTTSIATIVTVTTGIAAIVTAAPAPSPVVVAVGLVAADLWLGTSGGASDGGIRDEEAAAVTTSPAASVITLARPFTTPSSSRLLGSSASGVMPIDNRDGTAMVDESSLLPMMISRMINGGSRRGCGDLSGIPLGVRRIVDHFQHPPSAVGSWSAWRGGGRPTAFAKIRLAATPPRPGPASLLPPSMWPQHGHIARRGGRVGHSLRAAEETANRQTTTVDGRSSKGATAAVTVASDG